MTSRDWFMVGARLLGLWILYQSVSYLSTYIDFELISGRGDDRHRTVNYLFYSMVDALLGFYLLFGTNHLARLVHNEPKPSDPELEQIEKALKN